MISNSFRDFDEFAESIRDVDAVMTLQNPSSYRWEVKQMNFGAVDIQLGQVGS